MSPRNVSKILGRIELFEGEAIASDWIAKLKTYERNCVTAPFELSVRSDTRCPRREVTSKIVRSSSGGVE
jgi:hypothetical protein